eukprot:gnl/TRDRNA2_/TRDRNA2_166366_c0_seq2.p1 gnl/TRDRNA2_/TRDRNA2_166366_c0~~gnl/TRDRNA2_/TRDRNA2_166366_c0_seq2.p1  ORF type:complete len:148 (-),score=21.03 gnl/TRDRNA2_/TRDRNA2_166366_c0_seq2:29-418(-)
MSKKEIADDCSISHLSVDSDFWNDLDDTWFEEACQSAEAADLTTVQGAVCARKEMSKKEIADDCSISHLSVDSDFWNDLDDTWFEEACQESVRRTITETTAKDDSHSRPERADPPPTSSSQCQDSCMGA